MTILLSGATGFLGTELVKILSKNHDVYIISRNPDAQNKKYFKIDLLNYSDDIISKMQSIKFDAFIHLAALYDLTSSEKSIYANNIIGTNNALEICKKLQIKFFVQTSSIAAAINQIGNIDPDEINFSKPFPDPYSKSKAFTESMLKNDSSIPFKLNLRLGVLVGNTHDGKINRIDGPYFTPQALNRIRSLITANPFSTPLPGSKNTRLPLVPVDIAAQAIMTLVEMDKQKIFKVKNYQSLHLTPNIGIEIEKFYESTFDFLKIRHQKIALMEHWPEKLVEIISEKIAAFPKEQLQYILKLPTYNTDKTVELLGSKWCPEFSEYERVFWSGYEKYLSNRRN